MFCLGSGCGSVGRAVATNIRDPWINSSHWQKLILTVSQHGWCNCIEKTKINKKWPYNIVISKRYQESNRCENTGLSPNWKT